METERGACVQSSDAGDGVDATRFSPSPSYAGERGNSPRVAALAKAPPATDTPPHKAVFLDRDGVLIRTFVRDGIPHPPATLEQVEVLPGVPEALAALSAEGWLLLVVTNQPDVARGTQSRVAVEAMNRRLIEALPLDGVYVCFHDTVDRCCCRKPAPGMLLAAAKEHHIDLAASWMIGDRAGDIAAGAAAGCRTVLIDEPYSAGADLQPTLRAADLSDAARHLLNDAQPLKRHVPQLQRTFP